MRERGSPHATTGKVFDLSEWNFNEQMHLFKELTFINNASESHYKTLNLLLKNVNNNNII